MNERYAAFVRRITGRMLEDLELLSGDTADSSGNQIDMGDEFGDLVANALVSLTRLYKYVGGNKLPEQQPNEGEE